MSENNPSVDESAASLASELTDQQRLRDLDTHCPDCRVDEGYRHLPGCTVAAARAAALSDLAAHDAELIWPTVKAEESSVEVDYEAGFDWKAAWYALDHDAAQHRAEVEFLKRKIKVAHVLCLGTAPKQAVGEVLAAALSGRPGSGANTAEGKETRDDPSHLNL